MMERSDWTEAFPHYFSEYRILICRVCWYAINRRILLPTSGTDTGVRQHRSHPSQVGMQVIWRTGDAIEWRGKSRSRT